jgi:kynureninase
MNGIDRARCEALDAADALAPLRDEFELPEGVVYLDGNSLGALPKAARERARRVVEQEWGQDLIRSWNTAGWYEAPRRVGDKLGRLLGAAAGQVVATDATGINLYKVLAAALALRPERRVLVMEGSNFPTDNYVAQGLLAQLDRGHEIRFVEAGDIEAALDADVAALCLTQVHYKTGRVHDMAALTAAAHAVGALAVWDLAHSAGVLPLHLDTDRVDFAVGCTYKYLNGGPGSPGYLYVAQRHQAAAEQPLTGWWGHADPFAMERDYRPADGVARMLTGTQAVLSLSVAEVGIDLALRAGIERVRAKSQDLTQLFIDLVEARCHGFGLELASPRDARQRGSQVAFRHPEAYAVMQALIADGMIGDFRAPDILRFGFAPLYLRHVDVWDAVEILRDVLRTERWRDPAHRTRRAVT